jgi:hypothetical protein
MRGEQPEGGAGAPGGTPAGLSGMLGGAQVMNLSGQDLADLPEEKKQKLRMLGIDPDRLAAQQGGAPAGAPAPPAAEPPPGAAAAPGAAPPDAAAPAQGDDMDDRLEQLERLARLRDQGVLTQAEFEAQKQQILEG